MKTHKVETKALLLKSVLQYWPFWDTHTHTQFEEKSRSSLAWGTSIGVNQAGGYPVTQKRSLWHSCAAVHVRNGVYRASEAYCM